jgi:hypothetical protein
MEISIMHGLEEVVGDLGITQGKINRTLVPLAMLASDEEGMAVLGEINVLLRAVALDITRIVHDVHADESAQQVETTPA